MLNFKRDTAKAIWKCFKWKRAKLSTCITKLYTKKCIDYILEKPISLLTAEQIAENFFINETEVINYGKQLRADYRVKKEAYDALLKTSCKKSLYNAVMMYYDIGHETLKIRKSIYDSVKP